MSRADRLPASAHRPSRLSRVKRPRSLVGAIGVGSLLATFVVGLVQATPVTIGFRDFKYDGGLASRATADSPQSKLWYADGSWWGGLFKAGTGAGSSDFAIYKFNQATETWTNTLTLVDRRDRTHADYLWSGTASKLYVASTKSPCNGPSACNDAVRIYRYTYAAGTYTPDAGFPIDLLGGPYPGSGVSVGGADTVTVTRDLLGRVFVAWTRDQTTSMAYSLSDGDPATTADESTWSAPVVMNAGEAGQDNISGLIRFGSSVGLYYTDRHLAGDDIGLFAIHADADDPATWTTEVVASATGAVSDQANVKADASGNVYLVVKTGLTAPTSDQVRLFKRTASGWGTAHGVASVQSCNTRAQVAIQPTFDGGVGAAIVVMSNTDGAVYYKTAPLSGANALTFDVTGVGTPFIKSATDTNIFDPTTTKQVLTNARTLLAVATDRTSFY